MTAHCTRCDTQLTWTIWGVDEHLCDDVRRRLARREKQRDAVVAILEREVLEYGENTDLHVAEEIVTRLNQLGVTDDT